MGATQGPGGVDFQMVQEEVAEMRQQFMRGASTVEETISRVRSMIQAIESGVLVGVAGESLQTTLHGDLIPRLEQLCDRLNEMSADVENAMREANRSDNEAGTKFTD